MGLIEQEISSRVQLELEQRLERDMLVKLRAVDIRDRLMTTTARGIRRSILPGLRYLPAARDFEKGQYNPTLVPARSILRSDSSCTDSDSASASSSSSSRRVRVTDSIQVVAGPKVPPETPHHWNRIMTYAPVMQLLTASLRQRFGMDSSDPDGWVSHVEAFAWVDDVMADVRDTYQTLHDDEEDAFADLLDAAVADYTAVRARAIRRVADERAAACAAPLSTLPAAPPAASPAPPAPTTSLGPPGSSAWFGLSQKVPPPPGR